MVRFFREEGSNWHCEPMDRLDVELRMLDYLQDRLAETIASSNAISTAKRISVYQSS